MLDDNIGNSEFNNVVAIVYSGLNNIKNINHIKRVENDPHEWIKALIFSSMVVYYGSDYINEIFSTFLQADFVICNGSLTKFIKEKYNLDDKTINDLLVKTPGVFYDPTVTRKNGKYSYKRTIYMGVDEVPNYVLLNGLTHQLNHILNSIKNPTVKKKNLGLCAREGICLDHLDTRRVINYSLEGAINELQRVDIMKALVYLLSRVDIKSEIITKMGNFPLEESPCIEIINPLYLNPTFRPVLVKNRLNGTISKIKAEFDSKTGEGSYDKLLDICDNLTPAWASEKSKELVDAGKALVKRYIDQH